MLKLYDDQAWNQVNDAEHCEYPINIAGMKAMTSTIESLEQPYQSHIPP